MPTVYVTRRIPENGPDLLREHFTVRQWDSDDVIPRDVLLREVQDADGLLSLLTEPINDEVLDAAPNLKVVANLAVGFDNFDVPALTKRGVVGTNTPEVLTDTTADLAWTLMMAAARRIVPGYKYVVDGHWKTWGPLLLMGQGIHHATLGLVGVGRIGAGMARRAQGFSMRVLYYDVFRREDLEEELGIEFADQETVLRESDFVSLHTPYMPATHHLISHDQLKMMKNTAVLVNSSRGPVVDPDALYEALRDGEIDSAGLDVTEPEPLPADHRLLTLENCLVVPHIASASYETRAAMSQLAAENIVAVLSGKKPATPVNPEVVEAQGLQ